MDFRRSDHKTYRVLNLIIALLVAFVAGLSIWYLAWYWNFIIIPICLLIVRRNLKRFNSLRNGLKKISVSESKIEFETLRGTKISYKKEDLEYSLLVKKYIKPVRKIGFREIKKKGFLRKRKRIGNISVGKWPDTKGIALCLIKNNYSREKWTFDWSVGELFLIIPLLFGLSTAMEDSIIGELSVEAAPALLDLSSELQEAENKSKRKTINQTEEFVNSNPKD